MNCVGGLIMEGKSWQFREEGKGEDFIKTGQIKEWGKKPFSLCGASRKRAQRMRTGGEQRRGTQKKPARPQRHFYNRPAPDQTCQDHITITLGKQFASKDVFNIERRF